MKEKVSEMIKMVDKSMNIMIENLNKDNTEVDITEAEAIEKQINRFRDKLRKDHVAKIENEKYSYQIGTLYKDIFSGLERLADHVYDVTVSIIDYAD
jgi:phosphate:Na+ symporter